jgi:Ran-binding protein 1
VELTCHVCVLLHAVMPTSKLQEHTGSDKAWVWSAVDYADGEHRVELFCIRFGTPESEWRCSRRSSSSMTEHVGLAVVQPASFRRAAGAASSKLCC